VPPLGLAPGLSRKHQTRLKRLARNKRSSLLQTFVNYGRKKFYVSGHRFSNLFKILSSFHSFINSGATTTHRMAICRMPFCQRHYRTKNSGPAWIRSYATFLEFICILLDNSFYNRKPFFRHSKTV
jgi:hypothetical protein